MPADPDRSSSRGVQRSIVFAEGENGASLLHTAVGPFLFSLYLPFLVLLPRPVTRRAPRRQPSVSGRRPRRRTFARENHRSFSALFISLSHIFASTRLAPLVYLFAYLFLVPLPPRADNIDECITQPAAPDTGHFANARRFASILGYRDEVGNSAEIIDTRATVHRGMTWERFA